MIQNTDSVRRRANRPLLTAILLASSVLPITATAAAGAQDETENVTALGQIQVTGSRIRRANTASAKPVLRIDRQAIENSGLESVGQLLTQMTSSSASLNASTYGGDGAAHLNLRHLGSQRVLVLVNGQRWVSHLDGAVDLNTIPAGIVDHIEILQDGAAATYGSDAIAGVINIITKSNFNGARAQAYYGIYNGDGHWDGQVQQYELTFGQSSANNNFLLDLSFYRQNGIPQTSREISSVPVYGTGNAFGSAATPQGNFSFYPPSEGNFSDPNNGPAAFTGLTSQQCPTTNGGTSAAPHYVPYCHLTLIKGRPGTSPGDFRAWNPKTDPYNYAVANKLLYPQHRTAVYVQDQYALSQAVSFHVTALSNRRVSTGTYIYAEPAFMSGSQMPILIPEDNPYNPFGFDLTGTGGANDNVVLLARSIVEGGPRIKRENDNTLYVNGGFDGNFIMAQRVFDWSVDYVFSSTDETEHWMNFYDRHRFVTAVNGCQGADPGSACVPLNIFGGKGSITPEMLAWSKINPTDMTSNLIRDYQANISSANLFDLPGGPLGAALGYEYRSLSGAFKPNPYRSGGNIATAIPANPTTGAYDVTSVYGEVKLPLVQNVPGVQHLSLDIASRYSDFSSFGSNTSSQAGFRYNPIRDLLIRGTVAEAFRAPNISELAAGQAGGYPVIHDPCDASDANRPASCAAAGVPSNYNQAYPQIQTTSGGNPNLTPESSLSKTIGFVYSPSQVPGLDVNADYYHIKVDNLITTIGGQTILNGCYLANNQRFCDLVTRRSDGVISQLLNVNVNFGTLVTDGYDVGGTYTLPTAYGEFKFGLRSTFIHEFKQITPNPGGAPTIFYDAGSQGYPKAKARLSANWFYGNFDINLTARYIGDQWEDCRTYVSYGVCSNPEPNHLNRQHSRQIPTNHIGATVYYDAQVSYRYGPAVFTIGARNIFGRQPPISLSAGMQNSYNTGLYDLPGRFLYGRISFDF